MAAFFAVVAVRVGDQPVRTAGSLLLMCGMAVMFAPGRALGAEAREGALVLPMSPLRRWAPLAGIAATWVASLVAYRDVLPVVLAGSEAAPGIGRFRGLRVGRTLLWVNRYTADPVVLYWTLRYYATHPESRAELADGRAYDRVRREGVAP